MFARLISTLIVGCAILSGGCNTLSSLGLPTGSNANKILNSAKAIANRPGQSLMTPRELTNEPLANYLIGIGDSILIETVNFDATIRLPGDQIVRPDGSISLGQFGTLSVFNKNIEQVQAEAQERIDSQLESRLRAEYEAESQSQNGEIANEPENDSNSEPSALPIEKTVKDEQLRLLERRVVDATRKNQVSARLINWESKKIYVLGEVNSPGAFQYNGHQNVLDGIIEAGGLTSRANHHEIIVARPTDCDSCRVVMKICYDQIVQLGDSSTNYQLQPGDRVFVPSLSFVDDLTQSLTGKRNSHCPRCQNCPQPCDLPEGCQTQVVAPQANSYENSLPPHSLISK